MNTKIINSLAMLFILAFSFTSCEKTEYEEPFTPFGEVYFDMSKVALNNNGIDQYLKAKYNGFPIEMKYSNGLYRIPEGEAKFEFYDKRSGEVLLEKTVNVAPGNAEKFELFQPTEKDPIAILDPDGQADEEAAPEGFMKLKIANYATKALNYDLIDIEVQGLGLDGWESLDIISSIGRNLGEAEYHLVRKGENIEAYRFSYIVHDTQKPVLNARGTPYTLGGVIEYASRNPRPIKDLFTIFLSEINYGTETTLGRIQIGDDLYDVMINELFVD